MSKLLNTLSSQLNILIKEKVKFKQEQHNKKSELKKSYDLILIKGLNIKIILLKMYIETYKHISLFNSFKNNDLSENVSFHNLRFFSKSFYNDYYLNACSSQHFIKIFEHELKYYDVKSDDFFSSSLFWESCLITNENDLIKLLKRKEKINHNFIFDYFGKPYIKKFTSSKYEDETFRLIKEFKIRLDKSQNELITKKQIFEFVYSFFQSAHKINILKNKSKFKNEFNIVDFFKDFLSDANLHNCFYQFISDEFQNIVVERKHDVNEFSIFLACMLHDYFYLLSIGNKQ